VAREILSDVLIVCVVSGTAADDKLTVDFSR
jgi:hypothetical protein